MTSIAAIREHLRHRYPEPTAQAWDAVGLTVGRPEREVDLVLFALDLTAAVVAQARELGAGLIVTHHPLYLGGTTTVAADTPKGRVVTELIEAGIGHYNAHTNADIAPLGVNEALAAAVGLLDAVPLEPSTHPLAHPGSGIGRVGRLAEPITLAAFAERVATALPATAGGVRVAGEPGRLISRVAVCGGSGDSYLAAAAAAGVDAYLTADLRHHRAGEAIEPDGAPALIDASHFSTEWPWLPVAAADLTASLGVRTQVSTLVTDPWTTRLAMTDEGDPR